MSGRRRKVIDALTTAATALASLDAPRLSAPECERMFLDAAETIWGSVTFKKLIFKVEVRNLNGVLAALSYRRTGKRKLAIDTSLVYGPPDLTYTLILDPRILTKDKEVVRRIMVHEAVHIGYPQHDADFRRVVKRYNGALTEADATEQSDKPYKAQRKLGTRYETFARFATEAEAMSFIREQYHKGPSFIKWRLAY